MESHDATAVVVLEEAMVRILEYDLSQRQVSDWRRAQAVLLRLTRLVNTQYFADALQPLRWCVCALSPLPQDKEGNPHGEHAHDVYTLLGPPSAGVYRGPRKIQVVRSSLEGA